MKTVIVDIDGTIADLTHRRHFLPEHGHGKPADWDNFFGAMSEDKPIWPVVDLVRELTKSYQIVFVTGRPENYREVTKKWLLKTADFENYIYLYTQYLYMRKEKDTRPDYIVKKEILDQLITEGHDIAFCIDDRPNVLRMWRQNNIFTFAVGELVDF